MIIWNVSFVYVLSIIESVKRKLKAIFNEKTQNEFLLIIGDLVLWARFNGLMNIYNKKYFFYKLHNLIILFSFVTTPNLLSLIITLFSGYSVSRSPIFTLVK